MNPRPETTVFDPRGKGHWVLDKIRDTPRHPEAIFKLAREQLEYEPAAKVPYVIAALCMAGLIRRRDGLLCLSQLGRLALRRLDGGDIFDTGRRIRVRSARRPQRAAA